MNHMYCYWPGAGDDVAAATRAVADGEVFSVSSLRCVACDTPFPSVSTPHTQQVSCDFTCAPPDCVLVCRVTARLFACHTPHHALYLAEAPGRDVPAVVFTGDIMFVAGCGRFNGGAPAQVRETVCLKIQ